MLGERSPILRPRSFGDASLEFETDTPGKPATAPKAAPSPLGDEARAAPGADMGAALRSIYQATIDEQIPPEMLNLLRKLD